MSKKTNVVGRLPNMLYACGESCGDFSIIEAAAEGDAPKLKKISGTAYNGGPMSVGYGWPVVVELSGLQVSGQIPCLRDHDSSQIVGHLTAEIGKRAVKIEGVASGAVEGDSGRPAAEVLALAANGFPWQLSIGAMPSKAEFIESGESVSVNGKKHVGPLYVVRAAQLREVSFVAVGADGSTSARIAASSLGESDMNPFDKWLEANGWDKAKLSDDQLKTLEAAYKAEATPPVDKPIVAAADPVAETRARVAAELDRVAKVQLAAKAHPEIAAKAVAEGWDSTKTELEVLRASRPAAPAIHTGSNDPTMGGELLQCALQQTLKIKSVEKEFKPEILQAAHTRFRGKIGIQQIILTAAAANGMQVSPGTRLSDGNLREALRFAFMPAINAAFSTVSLPNIFESAANKTLLEGYMEVDQSWRRLAQIVNVSDFKDHKAYRLLDDMDYEELTPSGEIKHGTVGEETITRSADTFAKMFALTRKQIINDDLGAFATLRQRLGQGAARKFNSVFWTAFIDNSTFFTSARTNYLEGATTNLAADGVGLGLGVKAFRKMTSPSADATKRVGLGLTPKVLVVPPELEGIAESLYRSQNLAGVKAADANIYANKYEPVVVNQLSESAFTGYSTTAWYLFCDPMILAPMWAAFLNGQEVPTVESAEADFNTLGVQFRGYHDFGAGKNEYLAGVKSKGAA